MPQTQISCPNCKQPVQADVEQLFDLNTDPRAKELLLGGTVNVVRCPHCGYQGALSTPVVYHDHTKELLLTYFPQELNLPMEEQEKTIGPLITRVVDGLKQEDRKGYLFKPQQMFTFQTLLEKVLEGEGVTKEMIDSQKKRMDLLQRLITVSSESLQEVISQEEELIDNEFFTLLNRLLQGSLSSQDEAAVTKLSEIQTSLLEHSSFGREIKQQSEEIEAARKSLEDLGEGLTRENLMDLLEEAADKDVRLNALVSLTRPGLDYTFFQTLSEKIGAAEAEEKTKLTKLRESLLEITARIDAELQERLAAAQKNLEALLQAEDPAEALKQNAAVLDDFFLQVLNQSLAQAQEQNDAARQAKLQGLLDVIQQMITPGYNAALLQELIEAPDDETRDKIIEEKTEEITPEFVESLSAMLLQLQEGEDQELADKVRSTYRATMKASMQKGLQQPE
jgi:uncharacterized protein YutE (UPF0331/DUF86 family)